MVNQTRNDGPFPPPPPPLPPMDDEEDEYPETLWGSEEDYEETFELEDVYLDEKLEDIDDFIRIGKNYNEGKYDVGLKRYNINLRTISKLVEPLENLKKMIGMHDIKKDVFELLLYQLQEFDESKDMLHTIIDGEPGVGKTQLRNLRYCLKFIIEWVIVKRKKLNS